MDLGSDEIRRKRFAAEVICPHSLDYSTVAIPFHSPRLQDY